MEKNQHKYTIIPDELLGKQELSLPARVILGKILNLWKSTGKVKVSNANLSQLMGGLDERSIRRAKSELVKQGLITISQEVKGRGHLASIKVKEKAVNKFLGYQYFPTKGNKAVADNKNNTPLPPSAESWMDGMDKVIL